jgi:hypothetical protein
MGKDSPYRMPLAGKEQDPVLAARLDRLPQRARRAALAAGLEPMLSTILQEREAGKPPTIELLEREQELTLRLVALNAQVLAAAFEAGCTSDVLEKVATELGHREQARQLTIAELSLVLGAVLTTAAGVWTLTDDQSHGPAVLGIAAGGVSTALGVAALNHEQRSIVLDHPRNRIAPIRRGSDPDHLYPTFVFRMLTFPDEPNGHTPRDELLARWQRELDEAVAPTEASCVSQLLVSEGGRYDETLITLRAKMFETLESSLQGLARDLELLHRSLVRELAPQGPASAPSLPVAPPALAPMPAPT